MRSTRFFAPLLIAVLSGASAFAAPSPDRKPTPNQPGKPGKPGKPGPGAKPAKPGAKKVKSGVRWTSSTPEAMASVAATRAKGHGTDALAGLLILYALADRANAGVVKGFLDEIGKGKDDLAEQARWLSATLEPSTSAPAGLVDKLSVLGPFRDTSGRLAEKEFAEETAGLWGDRSASYSWGAYDVRWREISSPVTARGLPLGMYVSPRKESCSYVGSKVTLAKAEPVVVHVAAGGSARLIWDGHTIGSSDTPNAESVLDRLSVKVEATAGDHLVAVKVCSAALDDDGRVRIHLSSPDGSPIAGMSSTSLSAPLTHTFVKPRSTVVKGPLVRALEAATKTPEQALVGAIVRTKGGGEDLRAPKAPALIEQVASDPTSSADTIAIAGWVSPFGAVRSGWLNHALSEAIAESDTETADFSLRRLAASRIEAGFADWAMAALQSAPFTADTDPEAKVLRAMGRAAVGGESARRAALTEMKALFDELGTKASVGLVEQVASYARGFDPKLEIATRKELAKRAPERAGTEAILAAQAVDGDAVLAAVKDAITSGSFTSGGELSFAAGQLIRANKLEAARDLLVQAVKIAPNLGSLHAQLSEVLFTLGQAKDVAARALIRARDLEPGDATLRAQLAFRASAAGKEREPQRDERWMVPAETFLTRARSSPAKKGEVAERQPHWVRVVTFHEDRRVSQLIHYAREIVIAPRTQEELYELIPTEGDEIEILKARVHRVDGTTAFAEEQKSDGGRPIVRWPELKPGDIVEIAVRSWTSGPIGGRGDAPFYFFDYAGASSTTPLMYNEVIVDAPKASPLAIDVLNGKPDRVESKEEGGNVVTHYIWDHPPVVADEPLAPKPSENVPTIIGSSFGSWDAFRAWYRGAVEGFTEPDAQVREIAAKLTKGKKTRDEKLRALFEFVADDIRYVNYMSGEFWLPNRPSQLIALRQGDCDDKALLLITLLKSVGIDATEVLIQTRYTGQPTVLRSKKAAVPLFDHGIAYIPARNGEPAIWLDATSPQSRLGPLPSMDARTLALFVSEGPAEMVNSPSSSPDEHGVEASWTLVLDRDGAADFTSEETHRGDSAFMLRSNLREADARAPWVEQNLIAGWIPQVEVDKKVDFTPDLGKGEAKVKYKARSSALARREGDTFVVTLAPASTLTSQLAPLPKRTLPVVLPANLAPSKQSYSVKITAPEGMLPGDLPPGGDENGGEFGRAKLDVAVDPSDKKTLIVTRSVVFDMSEVPVAKYEAWRAWLSRVDALLHRSVRFVPAK